jgi:MoaA/NifB/PqqE/SkfB family radical SAM enzyme
MNTNQHTVESLKAHIGGKQLYLYGAGPRGRMWSLFFTHHKFPLAGFIDKSKIGKDIFRPSILEEASFREKSFIVVTAQHAYTKQIEKFLETQGLEKNVHFLNHTQLCSYYPTIETSGVCNLRCMSCNLGSPSKKRNPGGFMGLDAFKKILGKLMRDIPLLPSVYLYCWGEPLLNPELPQIIRHAVECGVGVEISTNLNKSGNLEKVIEAGPASLLAPCSGTGKNYEQTHTGGKWEVYRQNLHKLREWIDKYNAPTGVEIVYHIYKHNLREDYEEVERLAKDLGFSFKPIIANVFPERILEHVAYGEEIPEAMKTISDSMIYGIDEQIKYSKEKNKNCVMMNAFPVIRWNGSVIPCCNMEGGIIADDYATVPFDELKRRQVTSKLCKMCKAMKLQHVFYISGEIKIVDGMRQIIKS